jgi:hypothetical protein
VDVLVDNEEIKDSRDRNIEQGNITIVTSHTLESGLLVNVHGWTAAPGIFLYVIKVFYD